MSIGFYDDFSYEIILTLWLIVSKRHLFKKEKTLSRDFKVFKVTYFIGVPFRNGLHSTDQEVKLQLKREMSSPDLE